VRPGLDRWISLWLEGLPDEAKMEDVRVRLNGTDLQAAFLLERDGQGRRQENAKLPSGLNPGTARVAAVFDRWKSKEVEARLILELEQA
jgi:hypothetical protein